MTGRYVCDYLVHGGDREEFFRTFHPNAMSRGFDPDVDFKRVGLANQTTMLKVRSHSRAMLHRSHVYLYIQSGN